MHFHRRGLPISGGRAGATCNTLIKARMCQSGMRWTADGGQNILFLRTYARSNHVHILRQVYKWATTAAWQRQ